MNFNIIALIIVFGLVSSNLSYSDSEGKTRNEIELESDVIAEGQVADVVRFKKIDEFSSYFCATITVKTLTKGLHAEKNIKVLKVYFVNPTDDNAVQEHSPKLKKNDNVKLFLLFKSGITEEGYSLWIGTDERLERISGSSGQERGE